MAEAEAAAETDGRWQRQRQMAEAPTGFGFLADQLRRAASSVAFNLAEGNGYHHARQRANCFRVARGSAKEVAAILDVAAQYDAVTPALRERSKKVCVELGAMIYRWK